MTITEKDLTPGQPSIKNIQHVYDEAHALWLDEWCHNQPMINILNDLKAIRNKRTTWYGIEENALRITIDKFIYASERRLIEHLNNDKGD